CTGVSSIVRAQTAVTTDASQTHVQCFALFVAARRAYVRRVRQYGFDVMRLAAETKGKIGSRHTGVACWSFHCYRPHIEIVMLFLSLLFTAGGHCPVRSAPRSSSLSSHQGGCEGHMSLKSGLGDLVDHVVIIV